MTVDSDAAYLVEPNAHSCIAGYFQLNSNKQSNQYINGAILIECKTLQHVVATLAEAETAGLFHNSQVALPIRYMLEQMSHKQAKTPMKTDNMMSKHFIHNNIAQPDQNHGICDIIGFATKKIKENLIFIGTNQKTNTGWGLLYQTSYSKVSFNNLPQICS